MSYRVVLQEADGALLYSNAYDDKEGAVEGAERWSKHEDLDVLRIEASDGEVISAETISAALNARDPLSAVDVAL